MSGLFQKREKLHREPTRWKKELKLVPGYLILTPWILFTLVLLDWVLTANPSTIKEMLSDKLLESGFHMGNYAKAWVDSNVSTIFSDSLFYAAASYTLLILICAPAAYALSRSDFVCSKLIQSFLVASVGAPVVMIVPSLFAMVAGLNVLNNVSANRATLVLLYIGINISYTTISLTTFFVNLSRAFKETAAIDGCLPVKTFWLTMLPMAQPGTVTVIIFNFINIWNEYFISLIFGNPDRVQPVAVSSYPIVSPMRYTGDWVSMFSAVVIVSLPTFILYIFLSEKIITGVAGGGVKGQGETGSAREQGHII